MNTSALVTFFIFLFFTLVVTWWAARKTKSQNDFYAAGGSIKPWQNGLAISGDFMSAATFLGITSAIYFDGYDAFLLAVGVMVCWPLILFLIAERLRNLGRYTFVDVVSYRLASGPVRILAAVGSLSVVLFYLIGQMVGAGKLLQLLFGIDYLFSIVLVNTLMVLYVVFGGMYATTWVQLIKAVLLLLGGSILAVGVLIKFDFRLEGLLQGVIQTHPMQADVLAPGGWLEGPLSIATVGATMVFGFIGLPHILMRFFTVKDARDARKSVCYATSIMGLFYCIILLVGLGSIPLIMGNPEYHDPAGFLIGGRNMVALHLTHYVGGDIFFGFMSAVTFATILAVVAGLTLSAGTTIAHDLYSEMLHKGNAPERSERLISRFSIFFIGLLGIFMGIAFEDQNVVYIVTISLSIAASVNFPILLLTMYWRGLTTRGAVSGGVVGLVSSVVMIILGPQIWVPVFGHQQAIVDLPYPTLITMPAAFLTCWVVSKVDFSDNAQKEREAFGAQLVRSELGPIDTATR